jgi:hypothetical protein
VTDFYLTELFFIIVTGHLGAILSTVFWTIFVAQVSVLRGGGGSFLVGVAPVESVLSDCFVFILL